MSDANLPQRRLLASLCGALLAGWCAAPTVAAEPARHASAVRTSRWWTLRCSDGEASACVLTVRLRGAIDSSRLRLVEEALSRRDEAQRALGRRIGLRIDADTDGGEMFAAMEIGRLLHRESTSIHVARGARCNSACVLVLMGATGRSVERGACVGIHRPSLGDPGSDALVESMAPQVRLYAAQVGVPARIVDEMMAIPAERLRCLTPADLADYGIAVEWDRRSGADAKTEVTRGASGRASTPSGEPRAGGG